MGKKIPVWYLETTEIAKSYYSLLHQKSEIEKDILLGSSGTSYGMPGSPGPGNPTAAKAERMMQMKASIEETISAIQGALDGLWDDEERKMVRLNLFQKIPMHWINLPMSIITMKRVRRRFIRDIARRLKKIP